MEKRVILHSNLPVDYCDNVVGDPKRTRQVLANLVNNAIKFTEKGSICVAMSQTRTADDLTVSFAVTDSGIGIAPEDIARLFAPFIQADISTSRKFGGTGLGLAICKRLVEAMGGAIEVTSVPGQGSCFKFSVRVHRASAEEAQRHSSDARRYENAPLQVVPRRILLAEDNETSRFLIATMLRRRGHSVEAVTDGLKACEAVMTGPFDIVLMDMQMPVMDGPEATREIRKLSGPRGSIPIIALTADVIADHRKIYLQAGVKKFSCRSPPAPLAAESLLMMRRSRHGAMRWATISLRRCWQAAPRTSVSTRTTCMLPWPRATSRTRRGPRTPSRVVAPSSASRVLRRWRDLLKTICGVSMRFCR